MAEQRIKAEPDGVYFHRMEDGDFGASFNNHLPNDFDKFSRAISRWEELHNFLCEMANRRKEERKKQSNGGPESRMNFCSQRLGRFGFMVGWRIEHIPVPGKRDMPLEGEVRVALDATLDADVADFEEFDPTQWRTRYHTGQVNSSVQSMLWRSLGRW